MSDNLHTAWAEAEAALPTGWSIIGVQDDSSAPASGVAWKAMAHSAYLIVGSVASQDEMIEVLNSLRTPGTSTTIVSEGRGVALYESTYAVGRGSSPSAALRALAAALRETT